MPASGTLTSATNALMPSFNHVQSRPRVFLTALIAAIVVLWVRRNYRAFLALGQGGIPANPLGYCMSMMTIPFGKETTSTTCYDKAEDKSTWLRDRDTIPERRGERPQTGWHFLPHRQVNRFPNQQAKDKLDAIFARLTTENSDVVEITTSRFERTHGAMVIASSIPSPHKVADHAKREIAHIHPQIDYSLHLALSPQDCKLVIERGWGERHPLSGTRVIPMEYLMIYAPRDDEELEVVERILVASIGYMTGRKSVQ